MNGWILYSTVCERFDDVSNPCSTVRWLLHWIELRSLSHLECTDDHGDLLATVSTALPCERKRDELCCLSHSSVVGLLLVQKIIIEQIVDIVVVDFHEGHKDEIRTVFVQMWIEQRCVVKCSSTR